MGNIQCRVLNEEQFFEITGLIASGFITKDGKIIKPNPRISTLLILQGNLGVRAGDAIKLTLNSIVRDGTRYRLNIIEEKTEKKRQFTVPVEIVNYIQSYALQNQIKPNQKLFDITVRQVQKHLQIVREYMDLENISTHSFRKYFATSVYNDNDYNVELVRALLQHSSTAITQKYLGVQPQLVEQALQNHVKLPS